MTLQRIGVPCQCQNGHKATWWYRLDGLTWVDEGVKHEEKCDCPKSEFGQGYRRAEGMTICHYDRKNDETISPCSLMPERVA